MLRGAASGARCRGSAWPSEGCDELPEVVDLGLLGFWGHDLVEERLFTDLYRILSFLECICVFIGLSFQREAVPSLRNASPAPSFGALASTIP